MSLHEVAARGAPKLREYGSALSVQYLRGSRTMVGRYGCGKVVHLSRDPVDAEQMC